MQVILTNPSSAKVRRELSRLIASYNRKRTKRILSVPKFRLSPGWVVVEAELLSGVDPQPKTVAAPVAWQIVADAIDERGGDSVPLRSIFR